jgi:hypothetical protein
LSRKQEILEGKEREVKIRERKRKLNIDLLSEKTKSRENREILRPERVCYRGYSKIVDCSIIKLVCDPLVDT